MSYNHIMLNEMLDINGICLANKKKNFECFMQDDHCENL